MTENTTVTEVLEGAETLTDEQEARIAQATAGLADILAEIG